MMTKKLRYFCTLLLMAVASVAWAQTTHTIGWGSASGDEGTYTNFEDVSGSVDGVLSFTTEKNGAGSNPAYNANASELRLYYGNGGNGGSITITPADGVTITGAVITTSTSPSVAYYVDGGDATSVTGSSNTYTISNISASSSLKIQNVNTSNTQLRIKKIAITYTTGGSTALATTTAIDDSGITNLDVYTSTEAGSLSATVTETESGDEVSGATVTWTSSKESVATVDENGVVTLVAAGTTTITATYAGESGEFLASSATYELEVTSSAPYEQPTEFEIGLNNTLFGTTHNGSVAGITDENPIVGSQDNVTVTYAGGGNHYVNDNQIRFYPSNKLTFEAPDGYEIKEIVFTAASNTWAATISADGGIYDSSTKTWTGSATSVLFTGSGSSRCDMSKAAITLGEPSADPMVTVSQTSVNVPYTGGDGILTVQYQNIDDIVAVIQFYDEAGAEVDAGEYEVWFTAELDDDKNVNYIAIENYGEERTAYFKVFALVGNDYVYSDLITITQAAAPVVYTTIPEIFDAATSTETDVTITFNDWVISAVKGSNAYLTDNEGNGLIIYQSSHGFQVNDVLSGTANCKLVTYNGSAELKNLTATTEGLTVTADGSVSEQSIAIADLSGVNTGALVHYDGLTYDGTNLVDGNNNSIKPYNTLYSYTFEEGKTYNVTGIYLQYNNTKELLPRDANDIEEVAQTVTIEIKGGFTATTFSCDKALDFSEASIIAYAIYTEDGGTDAVLYAAAGEGLYIEGEPGTYEIPIYQGEDELELIDGNLLVGTIDEAVNTKTLEGNYTYYLFGKQNGKEAFFKVGESTSDAKATASAGKAYLAVPGAGNAKEMIVIGGEATAIDNSQLTTDNLNGECFDLSGRKLSNGKLQKGIYIVNGRKVVVK